jgi:hypothetical protein
MPADDNYYYAEIMIEIDGWMWNAADQPREPRERPRDEKEAAWGKLAWRGARRRAS